MNYTNRLFELRKENNISQERLATDLGISRRSISKIENGEQNPSLDMAYRFSAYFQLMIPDIFPPSEETRRLALAFSKGKENRQ